MYSDNWIRERACDPRNMCLAHIPLHLHLVTWITALAARLETAHIILKRRALAVRIHAPCHDKSLTHEPQSTSLSQRASAHYLPGHLAAQTTSSMSSPSPHQQTQISSCKAGKTSLPPLNCLYQSRTPSFPCRSHFIAP